MRKRLLILAITIDEPGLIRIGIKQVGISRKETLNRSTLQFSNRKKSMKKIIYNQFGTNEVLKLSDVAESTPLTGEILVEVKSASINPVDWKIRSGELKMMANKKFPKGIGCDFAGIVKEIGKGDSEFKVGDQVFGWLPYKVAGTFSESIIALETFTIKKPDNISFEEASCLGMIGGTALIALNEKGGITKNQEILINGCTGGVGHIATQIATAYGAIVTGICSEKNIDTAKKLGVDSVIDYKKQDIYQLDQKFDIIFDTVGNLAFKKTKPILKRKGKLLNLNPSGLFDILHGLLSSRYKIIMASVKKEHLTELAKLTETGNVKPLIGKIVKLEEAINAISLLEKGESNLSKTVITN